MCLSTEEVRVPDAEQATENGDVLLQRSLPEVLVHRVGTLEELVEVVVANVQSHARSNGRPDAVTSTDPVGETEHVLLVNAELGNLLLVGGESNKVLRDIRLLGLLQEPGLGSVGVCDGLSCGEGLGGNKEERGLAVGVPQCLSDVGSVNVGDEVSLEAAVGIRLESLSYHDGTARYCQSLLLRGCHCVGHSQVGTTNTNVDDGVNLLACVTLPLAAANLLGEFLDVLEDFVDALDDALAIDLHLLVGGVAKSYVVNCAVLGEVDLLASEHVIAELLDASFLGKLDKKLHSLLGDEVLGKVEQNLRVLSIVLEGVAELLETLQWR